MSLIRKHVAVLQAWACLDLVFCHNKRLNGYTVHQNLFKFFSKIPTDGLLTT